MFDVPFGYAYRDFSRLELDAYRDEHFMFGTVYNRIVGKEPGEVDFGQRFPVRGGAQADVHVLVVLVTHYVGTGREQRFSGFVFGFKQIVGCLPTGPILKIGTGRDSAYLKHRQRACAGSRGGNSGHFHRQIVVRAGELYGFGLVCLFITAVRQYGIRGRSIVK